MMKGPLCVLLLGTTLAGPAASAQAQRPGPQRSLPDAPRAPVAVVPSPDRRHRCEVVRDGAVRLDGRPVEAGAGRAVGRPVWRGDSRALTFLYRTPTALKLVVLPDLHAARPLIWRLPPFVAQATHVFWISYQRVGIGEAALVPRVVVSWTTTVAQRAVELLTRRAPRGYDG